MAVLLASVLFAWLTYKFIEKPLRFKSNKKTSSFLLLGLLSIGLLGYSCIASNGYAGLGFRIKEKIAFASHFKNLAPELRYYKREGITFLIATILIVTLPGQLLVNQNQQTARTVNRTLEDIRLGTVCLFLDPPIRSALVLQLVAAIAGAEILVNTVGYVQGVLHFGKIEYGWVMAAFGIGATIASIGWGNFSQKFSPVLLTSIGAVLITLALLPANLVNLGGLLVLWAIAGIGQTLVNVPTQTLIADSPEERLCQRVAVEVQGRVYGAHFAWSHLWWSCNYCDFWFRWARKVQWIGNCAL